MLKTIIVLPDGTEISSGTGVVNAIRSVTLTECVNRGEDLTIGSTCANALEATLITPNGELQIAAGTEVIVYKEDPAGTRVQVGVFVLEKPTRPTANTMKLSGYDRISKLDKDLTAWLSGLDGWPYTLTVFADMVCKACGLTYKESAVPNGDFLVHQFSRPAVTGRQIMQWLGEICARFCRATADGEIEFAWYEDSGKTIGPGGDVYYFQNGLSFEDYQVTAIDSVQIRLADSENGALWPAAGEGANSYIITGNLILNTRITEELESVISNIKAELEGVCYTPCKVSVPANTEIRAGSMVRIVDANGKQITTLVMSKTQKGQRDTLESTGSHRRDSVAATNSQQALSTPEQMLDRMTAQQMFNQLSNGGQIKGIFMKNSRFVVNADHIEAGTLRADVVKLDSGDDPTGYRFSSDEDFRAFLDEIAAELNLFEQKNFNAYLSFEPFNGFGLVSVTRCYALDRTTLVTVLTPNEYFVRTYMDGLGWSIWQYINGETEYTSGIWKVRHHKDGTCELWGTYTGTADIATAWGNVYYGNNVIPAQTFPVTFMNPPVVIATPQSQGLTAYGLFCGEVPGTTTATPSFCLWRATSRYSVPVRVDFYVKGTLA